MLLYHVTVRPLAYKTRSRSLKCPTVEITLTPNWLGKKLGRRVRVGPAFRATDDYDVTRWWWSATGRWVGGHIERYIEASPVLSVDD